MSMLDKIQTLQDLVSKGWTMAPDVGPYHLRPPSELIEALRALTLHVYDARDLQDFVPTEPPDDSEAHGEEKVVMAIVDDLRGSDGAP